MTDDILVLGGTGTTGRRIVRQLRDAGRTARSASRTVRAPGDVHFDLNEPGTWPAALDGATGAYLLNPDMGVAGDRLPRFVAAATAAGVRRLVLLSTAAADNPGHPFALAEAAVRDSGAAWTVVRAGWFAQNFGEKFWGDGVRAGELRLPAGDGVTAFVDAEDIAAVVVAALTGDGHHEQCYELTGPRACTVGEAVGIIAAASGRPVTYVDVDEDTFVAEQVAAGTPRETAEQFARLYRWLKDGFMSAVTDGVERALGRPPRTFEAYAKEEAAAGTWS